MALTVYWTKRADKKLSSITDYLNREWGEVVVKNFVKILDEFLDILSEFPEIGSIENPHKNIRGFVVVKQLTLFYRMKKDKIIILNLFDNRQNPKKRRVYIQ